MPISAADYLAMQTRLEKGKPSACQPADATDDESDLHDEISNHCKSKLWGVIHSRMDRKSHATVGAADFVILADNGRVFLIECKSKAGKLSPAQMGFKVQAEMNGHVVHVIRSLAEYLKIVT